MPQNYVKNIKNNVLKIKYNYELYEMRTVTDSYLIYRNDILIGGICLGAGGTWSVRADNGIKVFERVAFTKKEAIEKLESLYYMNSIGCPSRCEKVTFIRDFVK